jgi:hypothetical protein
MSKAIAKELDNRKDGDRNACQICNPKKGRVSLDKVWEWSKKHVGVNPWR